MNESMTQNTQEQVPLLPNMSARVYPVNDPKQEKGCVLANASVDLGGCFAVTGIKIVEGKDGPFVAMECGGGSFTSGGRTETAMGWKETERAYLATLKKAPKEVPFTLPELAEGQTLAGGDALLKSGTTAPPPRFTEDVCYKG